VVTTAVCLAVTVMCLIWKGLCRLPYISTKDSVTYPFDVQLLCSRCVALTPHRLEADSEANIAKAPRGSVVRMAMAGELVL
jgi:hypothetical protein